MSKRIDLLNGSIFKSLTALALPIMATSLIQMAYNMTDMLWLGRLSSNAVAAVGSAGMYVWLSQGFAALSRMGGQVKVAHAFGAGETDESVKYAKNSLQQGIVIALVYSAVMLLLAKQLVGFFKLNNPSVIHGAEVYLKIVGGGLVFSFINQIMTGLVTATGNSKTPFWVTTAGLALNIVLDPLLIFGGFGIKAMGAAGAGYATVIAQVLVTLLYFIYALKDELLFKKVKLFEKPDLHHQLTILKIGFPTAVQSLCFTVISMLIARMIATFGDGAVAAQKVGAQIESISWMTSDGFAAAINSFVAQNYGAKNYKRAKRGYYTALGVGSAWGVCSTLLLVFMAKPIFSLFINERLIIPLGVSYLVILGYSQMPMCVEIITAGAFSGFGNTAVPSTISIVLTVARIPMALFLSQTALGLDGIWWSISISSILKGVFTLGAFLIFMKVLNGQIKTLTSRSGKNIE